MTEKLILQRIKLFASHFSMRINYGQLGTADLTFSVSQFSTFYT